MFRRRFVLSAVVTVIVNSAYSQGTFQNLDFESAVIVPQSGPPFNFVDFAQAFPGWTGYVGGVQQTAALHDSAYTDTSGIAILDQGWSNAGYTYTHGTLIQGSYTALLMAGVASSSAGPADTSLTQSSLVPVDTESLRFRIHVDTNFVSPTFSVMIGSDILSLTVLQTRTNYITYGADIHQWAGQNAALTFTLFAGRPHMQNDYMYLDSILFSNQPIPEPSATILLTAAAGVCILRRLIRRARASEQT